MELKALSPDELESFAEGCIDGKRKAELKYRARHCCCSYCGKTLVLRQIVASAVSDGRVELFCPQCNRIEYGTEPEIFQAARYYVQQLQFDYYRELDDGERKERMNIAKVSEIISWGLKNMGLLTSGGLVGDIQMDETLLGGDLLISAAKLSEKERSEAFAGNSDKC